MTSSVPLGPGEPFGPDRAEVPELVHLSRGVLLVQSFEAFAAGELDELSDRSVEVVTFSGRWNKTEETTTVSVLLEVDALVDLIASLQKGLAAIEASK